MTDVKTVYPCECDCLKGDHVGGTYACNGCDCKHYRPDLRRRWDIAMGQAVIGAAGESTSRDMALAELTYERKARFEFDEAVTDQVENLRAERDLLRAELVTARAELARLRGTPVHTYPALYCTRCYARHDPDAAAADQHGHPLIPVQITVTRRENGAIQ